jgi:hypothetical protein
MISSIQEYLKKINRGIRKLSIYSILITTAIIIAFVVYLYKSKTNNYITYTKVTKELENALTVDPRPFASVSGDTYTFIWCKNASNILIKNRLYFTNQDEAIKSGRIISKFCQK